jgi:hypothetical protein
MTMLLAGMKEESLGPLGSIDPSVTQKWRLK